jgi:hypothetical protein
MNKTLFCFLLFIKSSGVMAQSETGQLVSKASCQKLPACELFTSKRSSGGGEFSWLVKKADFKGLATQFIDAKQTTANFFSGLPAPFPADFYSNNIGWFCKQESRFEHSTGLPLRFRLGSKEVVDWLEGKSFRMQTAGQIFP